MEPEPRWGLCSRVKALRKKQGSNPSKIHPKRPIPALWKHLLLVVSSRLRLGSAPSQHHNVTSSPSLAKERWEKESKGLCGARLNQVGKDL